jgi:hypothetical protein
MGRALSAAHLPGFDGVINKRQSGATVGTGSVVVEVAKPLSKVACISQTNDVLSINCECRF